jgi:spore coat polysaccharide biosynthesis protein SpsF
MPNKGSGVKNLNIVCIIQARMGSVRLPQKSMMLLGSKPMLQHVIERTKQSKLVSSVVLATTEEDGDDVLALLAETLDVKLYRGHSSDLVDRYYNAALKESADIIVRIPADNPLVHHTEIDRGIDHFVNSKYDFTSNIDPYLNNGYPDGFGAEIFNFSALEKIYSLVKSKYHREHVTSFFRDEQHDFNCGSCLCPPEISRPDVVLDVNTKDEYNFMNKLIGRLEKEERENCIASIYRVYDELIRDESVRK